MLHWLENGRFYMLFVCQHIMKINNLISLTLMKLFIKTK